MNIRTNFLGFLGTMLLGGLPCTFLAAQPVVPASQPTGLKFDHLRGQPIELFDGHSLDGWQKSNGKPASNWVVEDGVLYRKANGGDLYYQHWFRNFELEFEWKITSGGNSGVKYRVQRYGQRKLGCEYQIFDDRGKPFTKQSTGALYALYEPAKSKTAEPLDHWNQSKIVVCGNRIQHWLNGQLLVDASAGNAEWLRRVADSKFNKHPGFGQNREGQLFLQDHGRPVWFRKLTLTPLAEPSDWTFFSQEPRMPSWLLDSE